jgi:hypothetical protein
VQRIRLDGDKARIVSFLASKVLTDDRAKRCRKLSMFCVALLAVTPLFGQSDLASTAQGTVSYSAATSDARGASDLPSQSPYLGGVPAGKASATTLSLSLEDAVARGLRQNLGGLLSSDALSGAQGERWRALSALLPNLTTATSFGVRQVDVRSLIGIHNVPGHPPVLGLLEYSTHALTLTNQSSIGSRLRVHGLQLRK